VALSHHQPLVGSATVWCSVPVKCIGEHTREGERGGGLLATGLKLCNYLPKRSGGSLVEVCTYCEQELQ
jgi:hypothetical protein